MNPSLKSKTRVLLFLENDLLYHLSRSLAQPCKILWRTHYQAVLGEQATLAGPGAAMLRSGHFTQAEVTWFKDHYFQTELELGRCLRLPQEGPCECDLYLTCAKFVTTPAYAPRLRRRLRTEQELIETAAAQGWQREVERHQCTIRRIEQLLTDLGELLDGPETSG